MNQNLVRGSKPVHLIIGTVIIALLAVVASPNFATAHTATVPPAARASHLCPIDLGISGHRLNHPLINPKAQLIRLIAQKMDSKGVAVPSNSRQNLAPSQIRPDVWAGSVTVVAQAVF